MRAPSIRRQKPDVKKAACTLFCRVQAALCAKLSRFPRKESIVSVRVLNFKRLFLLSAAVLLLGGCATTVRIHDTVRWRGKDVSEFIAERAGRMPDIVRYNCVKNKEVRNLYAWRIALYDVRQAYVGQQGNVQYYQNYKHYTGEHTYRIVVTDTDGTIVSVRDTAFGNADKEYGCEEYRQP